MQYILLCIFKHGSGVNANEGNVLGFLTQEDKLDGTSYSLWSFMVHDLLVAKNVGVCYGR